MSMRQNSTSPLTKVETVALWHAVSDMEIMFKQMAPMGIDATIIEQYSKRLADAKRALRKVNELRGQGL